MKKILLTESQVKLLLEEIDKNDSIQRLIFCEPSDISFEFNREEYDGGHAGGDLFRITPTIDGKQIDDRYLSLSGEELDIDGDKHYQLNIYVNPDYRRYGIAKKMYLSLIQQGFPLCSLFANRTCDAISKLWDNIANEEGISIEDIFDEDGNNVGVSACKVFELDEDSINAIKTMLNESVIDESKISEVLFRGCKKFSDYAKRITYAILIGVLTVTAACSIVKSLPGSETEKQALIQQIEDTASESNEDNNSMLKKNYVTDLHISWLGISHIKKYEKCVLHPYYATKGEEARGIKTIGWGHKIVPNDPDWLKNAEEITREQADELFYEDIRVYENELSEVLKKLPPHLRNITLYPQNFIDMSISILYNSGRSNFIASPFFQTLKKCRIDRATGKINEEDFYYTCSKIKESCITQNGEELMGLKIRRNEESIIAQQ